MPYIISLLAIILSVSPAFAGHFVANMGGNALYTHATDCTNGGVLAPLKAQCVDLDDGSLWTCKDPTQAGASSTLCDAPADWILNSSSSASGVSTFNSRAGVVVPTAGDYTAAQITNTPEGAIAGTTAQAALNELDSEKQPVAAKLTELASFVCTNGYAQYVSGSLTCSPGTGSGGGLNRVTNDADSEEDSVQIGTATRKIKFWCDDTAESCYIKLPAEQDLGWQLGANKSGIIEDSTGADMVRFDSANDKMEVVSGTTLDAGAATGAKLPVTGYVKCTATSGNCTGAATVPLGDLSTSGASTGYVPTYNGSTVAWAAGGGSGTTGTTLALTPGADGTETLRVNNAAGTRLYSVGSSSANPAMWLTTATPSGSNYSLLNSGGSLFLNSTGSLVGQVNSSRIVEFYTGSNTTDMLLGLAPTAGSFISRVVPRASTGTNIAGANLHLVPGSSTGNAAGGTVKVYSADTTQSSGSSANTQVTTRAIFPVDGGFQLATGTRPTCDAAHKGTIYYVAGAGGVLDTAEVCRKDAADAYAWVSVLGADGSVTLQQAVTNGRNVTDAIDSGSAVCFGGATYKICFYANATDGSVIQSLPAQHIKWKLADNFEMQILDAAGATIASFDEATKTTTLAGALIIPTVSTGSGLGWVGRAGGINAFGLTSDNRVLLNAPSGTGGRFDFITGGDTTSTVLMSLTKDGAFTLDPGDAATAPSIDFSKADSSLPCRVAAGASPTNSGSCAYDSTSNTFEIGVNGANKTVAMTDSNITGNAATATALAANGGNCTAGQSFLGVDASGAAESCTAVVKSIGWDADDLTVDGTNCVAATKGQINGGPNQWTFACADSNSSIFEGHVNMPDAWNGGTVTFEIELNHATTETITFAGDFSAMCRRPGAAVNSTWGTAIAADVSITTAYEPAHATTTAVTPNGSCAGGDDLYWRYVVDAANFSTNAANARITGVKMEYTVNAYTD